MSNLPNSLPKSGLGAAHVPIDLGTHWLNAVIVKLKAHRALALQGLETFRLDDFEVPLAVGFIELIGGRTGSATTSMLVGFTDSTHCPTPTFQLRGSQALGTLVLPGKYFGPWLEIAKASTAHFRMGGDGQWNALASDSALLKQSD